MADGMDERHYRDLLDDAIGSSPPSSIDVDAVISGQRRITRTRRTAAAASAAVVVAAIGLATSVLLPGHEDKGPGTAHAGVHSGSPAPRDTRGLPHTPQSATNTAPAHASPGSTSPAAPPSMDPSSAAPPDPTLSPDRAQLFWPQLRGAIHKQVSDAKILPPRSCGTTAATRTPMALCPDGDSPAAFLGVGQNVPYFIAEADVPGPDGTRGLYIVVRQARTQRNCSPAQPECDTRTGPNGERIVSTTLQDPPGAPANGAVNAVSVTHPDGTEVIVTAQNWSASAGPSATVELKHAPADLRQLREIALTPQVSLGH